MPTVLQLQNGFELYVVLTVLSYEGNSGWKCARSDGKNGALVKIKTILFYMFRTGVIFLQHLRIQAIMT